ncbi:RxLR effector protein [Phytophthora megakarya]|uniref:RxLR effector protein n=1 Tax=Phytophthora megakarya TaxID=4795 RepID=A0A225X3N7_9STRA|nr:RxLR effector protein [Phytophthora megakarya]
MATVIRCTTLETPMQMQSCRLFWHKSTLSIILKRELADCTPSREIPVLYIKRPAIFGGDLEIDLGGSIHPVRMLPVSGKDVRNLRFGLVYGPKRKRVRFRAPDAATYDNWEMILEVAVEKAAAERPTFPTWPYPGPSPSLSALEDGYTSEEFGFSDNDGTDENKLDVRYNLPQARQNVMTGSFVDFIDPPSPQNSTEDTTEEDYDRVPSTDSAYEVSVMPLAREVEVTRPTVVSSHKWSVQHQEIEWCAHKPQFENPFATRLRLQLLSNSGPEGAKFSLADYLTWFRGGIDHSRELVKRQD